MAIKKRLTSDTSTSSLDHSEALDFEEERLHSFANQMLKGRLFIGDFQEKRYVANIAEYRDVVVIAHDERDLHVDLAVVRKRLMTLLKDRWVGITMPDTIGAPAGYCVWVNLPEEVFGTYWYKIRSVHFTNNEVLLKVKPLRSVSSTATHELCKVPDISNQETVSGPTENLKKIAANFKRLLATHMLYFFTHVITLNNIKDTAVFLVLLIGTVLGAGVSGGKYFLEFSLKLLHEISDFVKAATPICIACIDMIGKLIGGLYMLIAMLLGNKKPLPPPSHQYQGFIPGGSVRPMITYRKHRPVVRNRSSGVVITELN